LEENEWLQILHITSKHIEESIRSLETTLFGGSFVNDMTYKIGDLDETADRPAVEKENKADDDDDYDVVNEILDDYIDFDTAIAMTSAIMED
jgi:hypothetical protein